MKNMFFNKGGNNLFLVVALVFLTLPGLLRSEEQRLYSIRGVVIDKTSREPVQFVTVSVWRGTLFAITDQEGKFEIPGVTPGSYRVQADLLGYNQYISEEFMVSAMGNYLRLELEQESVLLNAVTENQRPIHSGVCPKVLFRKKASESRR
jgi:hypothetical protein